MKLDLSLDFITRSKYGNKRTGGHASKKEHERAVLLHMMERAGLISNLREQVPYELIPNQYGTDEHGKRKLLERKCQYIADFVYTDNETGHEVVEDTKGVRTDVYKIKRKLMLERYGIRIKET